MPMKDWFFYVHTNGNYITKRWFSELDMVEAEQSPFVREVHGPYPDQQTLQDAIFVHKNRAKLDPLSNVIEEEIRKLI